MGTCFFLSITEARGIDLLDETTGYPSGSSDMVISSDFSGAINADAKDALLAWVNSDEMRLSGID